MQTVLIKPFHHRGREVMGLHFEWDNRLINIVKQVKDVRGSRTYTCWYLPCTRPNYDILCTATSGSAVIDNRLLKDYLKQKQALVSDLAMPVHKTTTDLIMQFPLNIITTIRYTHVAQKAIEKIHSPIDRLGF
jgi:integrase/recombinase XerD